MSKVNYKRISIDAVIASLTALAVVGIVGLLIHIMKNLLT